MNIQKVSNGYIVSTTECLGLVGRKFSTLDEVMDYMLMHFEGRGKSFGGDLYGKVIIERARPAGADEVKP